MEWMAQNLKDAKRVGENLSGIELETNDGFVYFDILETERALVFGGYCNTGFLQSGFILKDGFTVNETLQALVEELEMFYNEGAKYTSLIVFNDRM